VAYSFRDSAYQLYLPYRVKIPYFLPVDFGVIRLNRGDWRSDIFRTWASQVAKSFNGISSRSRIDWISGNLGDTWHLRLLDIS